MDSAPATALSVGLADGLIDGVIYGAKDIAAGSVAEELREMARDHPAEVRLFDPQYYACLVAAEPGARLGALAGTEGYPYFGTRRRRDLERERQVASDLESCLEVPEGVGRDRVHRAEHRDSSLTGLRGSHDCERFPAERGRSSMSGSEIHGRFGRHWPFRPTRYGIGLNCKISCRR